MAIWLTSGAEVLLQMMTGLGLYRAAQEKQEEESTQTITAWHVASALLICLVEGYNTRLGMRTKSWTK